LLIPPRLAAWPEMERSPWRLATGFEVGVGSSQSLIPIPADISQYLLDISEAHLCQMGAASLGLVEAWTRYPDLSGCATVPLKLGQAASDAPRKGGLPATELWRLRRALGCKFCGGGAAFVTRSGLVSIWQRVK
jgi:hypothetical protein